MDEKPRKTSPETQKFLEDLEKRYPHVKVRDDNNKDELEEFRDIPRAVMILYKILYQIFNIGGFLFMIAGGMFSLICVYSVYKGIMRMNGIIYIILYLVIMFLVKKISFWLYRIINEL